MSTQENVPSETKYVLQRTERDTKWLDMGSTDKPDDLTEICRALRCEVLGRNYRVIERTEKIIF